MILGRAIGRLLLALAALCLFGSAIILALHALGQEWAGASSLGALWFMVHSASLNLVQATIQRYVWPPLWDPVLQSLLVMPLEWGLATLALVLGAIGLALCSLCRARKRSWSNL